MRSGENHCPKELSIWKTQGARGVARGCAIMTGKALPAPALKDPWNLNRQMELRGQSLNAKALSERLMRHTPRDVSNGHSHCGHNPRPDHVPLPLCVSSRDRKQSSCAFIINGCYATTVLLGVFRHSQWAERCIRLDHLERINTRSHQVLRALL